MGAAKEAKGAGSATPEQIEATEADIRGDRRVLKTDSFIPAAMALIYLALMMYFKSIGGYKPETIDPEKLTGGTEGPGEG